MTTPDTKKMDKTKGEEKENPKIRLYRMMAEGLTNCVAMSDGQPIELTKPSTDYANKLVAITSDGFSRVINVIANLYEWEPGFVGLGVVGEDVNQFKTVFVCDEPTEHKEPTPLSHTTGHRASIENPVQAIGSDGKIFQIDESKLFHLASVIDIADKASGGVASQLLFENIDSSTPKAVTSLKTMMSA